MKHSAYIETLQVASNYHIVVYGHARGLVSAHRSVRAAYRAMVRDRKRCVTQGVCSDASVYVFKQGRWIDVYHVDDQLITFA